MDFSPFDGFTNEEKERINQLYGNDFQNITPDDALLIGRWESAKTLVDADFQARQAAIEAETQAKLEQSQAVFNQAMENLNAQQEAAMRRLEAFNDGI